jgi:hypothetical protein
VPVERRLKKLLDLLDQDDDERVGTSMRLPVNLREAAALAVEMGFGTSTTDLTVDSLRHKLEAFADLALLEAHYTKHPSARPDLAEVALAMAELDGNPLAERPDLLRRAATDIVGIKPDADADDVLLYAAGLAAAVA